MYHVSYVITGYNHLSNITRLADFYCALPILSASLGTALWRSPLLIDDIPCECYRMIKLAAKLRHPELFRDCFVHSVSLWTGIDSDMEAFADDKELLGLIISAHYSICKVLAKVNMGILQLILANEEARLKCFDILTALKQKMYPTTMDATTSPFRTAPFYLDVYKAIDTMGLLYYNGLEEVLYALLKNNLMMDPTKTLAGEDWVGFLCAEVADEDLPWDRTQTDW